MKVSVIIAAAGSGSRMQANEKKQFMIVNKKPLMVHTVGIFSVHPLVDEIVVVTNEEDIPRVRALVLDYGLDKVVKILAGGDRRQDSIFNGLTAISGDVVMIHDAARPFVDEAIINRNLEKIKTVDALITCVPCKDTIKRFEGDVVHETLERSKLINVQTPQTFKRESLLKAYDFMRQHKTIVTDDASLAEAAGYAVHMVMGAYTNIKITTQEDLDFAKWLMESKR